MITLLTILGALGIFLYGMKVMSEGIQKVAGAGMRMALATMTKNRLSSIFTGIFTTTLVQSSSATTVLVVSFVNVGLLTLVESIGVIMGANLGTTTTAWIVAAVGKFSVSSVALPIIGVGLPLFFVGKDKVKSIGEVLIGFGLLFFGLGELKGAVPDLKSAVKSGDQGTIEVLMEVIRWIQATGFASVFLFMLAGVLLTLTVQSSSAAMAITITFAMNGWLGDDPLNAFKNSAAIVLGENIGTTVTAWLASIGANTAAKRAARAHLMFNVIGVLWMLVVFTPFTNFIWSLADILPENLKSAKDEFGNSEVAFATAVFHTSFNLINIAVLVWFIPQIARTVERMVPEKSSSEETQRIKYISQTLVDLGELNVVEAEQAVESLATHCSDMFKGYIEVFNNPDADLTSLVQKLKNMEDEADQRMLDITEYLVKCSTHETSPQLSNKITTLIRMTAELEECSDSIYRLIKLSERKHKKDYRFNERQNSAVVELHNQMIEFFALSTKHCTETPSDIDMELAHTLNESIIKTAKADSKKSMNRMADGEVKIEMLHIDTNNQINTLARHLQHVMQIASDQV